MTGSLGPVASIRSRFGARSPLPKAMDRNMGVKAAEMAMREIKKTGKKKIFMVFEPQWGLLVKNSRQVLDCQVWVLIQD